MGCKKLVDFELCEVRNEIGLLIKKTLTVKNNPSIVTKYNYSSKDRLISIESNTGNYAFKYDVKGRLIGKKIGSLGIVKFNYDKVDRVTSKYFKKNLICQYQYDKLDRRTTAVVGKNANWKYKYDDKDQLIGAKQNENLFLYKYDGIGNRLKFNSTKYKSNNLNQYTEINTFYGPLSPVYDVYGNMTFDGVNSYSYNDNNRLIKYESPKYKLKFKYDSNGRRISKIVIDQKNNKVIKELKFVYDGFKLNAEVDAKTGNRIYSVPRNFIIKHKLGFIKFIRCISFF
jgi:YD repeat-containing protein